MDSSDAMDNSFQPEQQDSAILKDILQILENNGTGTFESPNMGETQSITSPGSMSSSSASSSPTYTSLSQRSPQPNTIEGDPYIRIVEQPHPKGLRFRYICEGRSAGSIPGINSTPENKTFPTIEIVGHTGNVKIIVSCVTADEPHRPHPHNLVGKEGCEHGVCTMRLKGAPMRAAFSNLGIQCVKKKDIKAALEERERINIDPFKTKFAHKDQPSTIDLNIVRLCFQAFIPTGPRQYYKLKPVVTEPIYDKKSINDLVICRLCSCSAKVNGGDTIFLLCEKLPKDDIKIRFYEEKDNNVIWEDYGEFQQTDIHKQTAIAFKTPRYHNTEIVKRAQVFIQLVRFSNEPAANGQAATFSQVSDPLPFEFYPDPGMRSFPRLQRKLKRRQDMEIFQQILSLDSEITATKYSEISLNDEADNDLDNDTDETVTTDSSSNQAHSSGTLNENEDIQKRHNSNVEDGDDDEDDTDNYKYNECHRSADMELEFPVPQISFPSIDDCTQTSTPMEEILRNTELGAVRQLAAVHKINEWMKSNEFERTDSLTVETGDAVSLSIKTADDKHMNTEFIEQDIDLENQPDLELLTSFLDYDRQSTTQWDTDFIEPDFSDIPLPVRNFSYTASDQASVDVDDNFDDSATYTSLQIAFENPIDIPELPDQNDAEKGIKGNRAFGYHFTLSPTPQIQVNAAQPPQTTPSPPLPLPPRTPSPVPEQMLPPLPPKRKPSQELEVMLTPGDSVPNHLTSESSSRTVSQVIFPNTTDESPTKHCPSSTLASRALSQITITNTPEESPAKRSIASSPSPNKKQGFFSRFFSRRKNQNKRKRLRSGGNPMRIIQELQQLDQMHKNNSNNNNTSNISNTMWNIPPAMSSPAAPTVPEIKNEPFLSPNYCGAYRTPYQMSPSPQPTSPMNRNSATPSPGLLKTSSGESQSQMCSAFNQIQMNYNYTTPNVNINCSNSNSNNHNNNPFLDGGSNYPNGNLLHPPTASPSNPFFNPTSGGSITPLYPQDNQSNTSQFHAFNMTNSSNSTVTAASTLNIVDNQFQYQYQYQHQHQQQQQTQAHQPDDTNEAVVTLNALLQIDSDKFVNINSEELRLSNLSIST